MTVLDSLMTWLVRYLHVLAAAVWVGGYAGMVLVIVPTLARDGSEPLRRMALTMSRVLSGAGTLTILAGLVLIARSRGYEALLVGEWGGTVIASAVLAVALMGVGDSGLRPALRRLDPAIPASVRAARRWALGGLLLGVVVVGLMTRALYARS